jgi:NAD/NADP transhydrogenase beta subunit
MLAMFQRRDAGPFVRGRMSIGLVGAAYVAAAILFILSLGGLSNQEAPSARSGTASRAWRWRSWPPCSAPEVGKLWVVLPMIAVGAALGYEVARRVQMTEMPQLVAALHSFVGLARCSSAGTPTSSSAAWPAWSPPRARR